MATGPIRVRRHNPLLAAVGLLTAIGAFLVLFGFLIPKGVLLLFALPVWAIAAAAATWAEGARNPNPARGVVLRIRAAKFGFAGAIMLLGTIIAFLP